MWCGYGCIYRIGGKVGWVHSHQGCAGMPAHVGKHAVLLHILQSKVSNLFRHEAQECRSRALARDEHWTHRIPAAYTLMGYSPTPHRTAYHMACPYYPADSLISRSKNVSTKERGHNTLSFLHCFGPCLRWSSTIWMILQSFQLY